MSENETQMALGVGGPRLDASGARAARRLREDLASELVPFGEVTRIGRRGERLSDDLVREARARAGGGDRWPDFVVRRDGDAVLVRAVAASEKNAARAAREWAVEPVAWEFLRHVDEVAREMGRGKVVLVTDARMAATLRELREGRDWEGGEGPTRFVAIRQTALRPMAEVLGASSA